MWDLSATLQGDINALYRKLGNLEQLARVLEKPMRQSTALIRDELKEYVPKSPGAFSRLATPKQRRAYWAKVKSGKITNGSSGYVRTMTGSRKWTTKVTRLSGGVRGQVGNTSPYQYVWGAREQQPFHRASGFPTTATVLNKNARHIVQFFQHAVNAEMNK